jgi:Gti1/Pac2 family transcription factor
MPRINMASTRTSTTVTRTYAPFPTIYSQYPPQSKASESVLMYEPYENTNLSGSYAHDPSPRYTATAPGPDPHDDRSSLPPIQSYFDATHGVSAPSAAMGYPPISSPIQIKYPVTDSLEHPQRVSNPTTPCISAHPASDRPSQNQQTPAYPVPTRLRSSPSPPPPNIPHTTNTYVERSSGYYFPAESPPTYTDGLTHHPSPAYGYPPQRSTRHGPSTDSDQPYRHESDSPSSQPSPSHRPPPLRVDPFPPSYDLLPTTEPSQVEGRRGSIGPDRDLAPIYALTRPHPYRRDPLDDKTLRLLTPRSS